MTKIKFCGLKRECDIVFANALQPEYIGFVFAAGRKRYLPPKEAERLHGLLSDGISSVGVFVNEEPQVIGDVLRRHFLDVIQLHGEESEAYIRTLRNITDLPIIKAFGVSSEADIEAANASTADMILLDSGAGGMGQPFDWTLLRNVRRDYFLAGGLDAANVQDAVLQYGPYAVDVSSGVETDGGKDRRKMEAFLCAVRQTNFGSADR